MRLFILAQLFSVCSLLTQLHAAAPKEYPTKSGVKTWVDPDTPLDRQTYKSSRGRQWDLVMSDEFNVANRSFRPGDDHLWTSLEKPDGVNGALELYAHNMTSTECDDETGTCYFFIKAQDELTTIKVYNQYSNPPGYQNVDFLYRAAMVQSWNKFCFQGGMVEVKAQLPGATTKASGNPDIAKGPNGKVEHVEYYPTWPGIWMMGNLGRAIFSASTNRMWPFSYDECSDTVFNSTKNQRISACNGSPGFGLNPNQGRGAPEIDIFEGGGLTISSSIQLGPGMPTQYRMFYPNDAIDGRGCFYTGECKTPGANNPGVPTALYNKRSHKSWYHGLRYQGNPYCAPDASLKQSYQAVTASIAKGITVNSCTLELCPASFDPYGDLGLVDGKGTEHWGIDYNGTCFPKFNTYTGSYLCDPDNQDSMCSKPRNDSTPPTNTMTPFNYQMDAISSNWPVHVGAYTDFLVYQLEWVTGSNGYVRWMLDGYVIFEVTAETIENVPQDANASNPKKKMLEEPMYLIFNVAISSSWSSTPMFTDKVCRGDGKNAKAVKICDAYPMYLKIDYIRLYQDLGTDLDDDNLMQLGCDPASHPTKEWIEGHIKEYTDDDNPLKETSGGAFCTSNDDCTVSSTGDLSGVTVTTGKCVNKRCACSSSRSWGGPRCTIALSSDPKSQEHMNSFGPPIELAIGVAVLVLVLTTASVTIGTRNEKRHEAKMAVTAAASANYRKQEVLSESTRGSVAHHTHADYTRNFV